jgi:hypothetical protein
MRLQDCLLQQTWRTLGAIAQARQWPFDDHLPKQDAASQLAQHLVAPPKKTAGYPAHTDSSGRRRKLRSPGATASAASHPQKMATICASPAQNDRRKVSHIVPPPQCSRHRPQEQERHDRSQGLAP